MTLDVQLRRFTVEEYHKLIDAGILGEDDRVELIEGKIIAMTPIGPPHSGQIIRLTEVFYFRLGRLVLVSAQNPVSPGFDSEPQPDLTLLIPREDRYSESHPLPHEVILLVEVADLSVDYDRRVKAPLYAKAGIKEYRLINLVARRVEVYRQPEPDGYGDIHYYHPGDRLTLLAFPTIDFAVDEILG